MKKKILWGVLIVLVLAAVGFFGFAPGIVEGSMNKVVPTKLVRPSDAVKKLHASLQIADMHADTLMWNRSLLERSNTGQVDLPRLLEGNVALQVFSSVTKTPKHQNYDANSGDTDNITLLTIAQLQPPKTWTSLLERSLFHARKLDRAAAGSNGKLRVIHNPQELDQLLADRAAGRKVVGGMLSIEGLQDLEGQLGNLDKLHAAGFRMAGLAHFFDNDVAGSMHGMKKGGLTPLGRQVLARMEQLGMIVDIAHSSHESVAEILRLAKRPVVSSHGGVQATCKVNRNLTDEEIKGVARTGGVVGIGYWDAAVCGTEPANVVRAILHVRQLVGIDHVGLGSDFDGAVTTGWDSSQLIAITGGLLDAGLSPDEIRKVMGGNVLRVLRAGIVPGT
ncbi:microsomal dipeptidase-like Zn-dependent dipeptidase [Sphingomonas kyeonggiensis]|uniref:Microsomal dipeptidase-like Zn-dependent dipeptidase n=1 Tax=Sphingomonas kyeonggiensis TaxID=1268553 RepID=A0A7W7JY98_9SPHN|nr:dipeptidase [Sphingomonas kyeonggiensis]MBB4837563.1 microsomal dipeptidase-like Zn-dependent dipeptidase [Sphingomonas kyeonggiensis]